MAADTITAWVLNLDADIELGEGPGWQPSRAVREHVARHAPAAARALMGPDDVQVCEGDRLPGALRGIPGRAFCPTPRALGILRAAGAEPEPAPDVEVLRRVNHRRFCLELGEALPGARFFDDESTLCAHLEVPPPVGSGWLLKRPFSVAGRGQRRARGVDEPTRRWARASLARGHGLLAEPFVDIDVEWVVHGLVTRRGEVRTATPRVQQTEGGAWTQTRAPRPGELGEAEARTLGEEVRRVGLALGAAGYFGPYGLDAYRWLERSPLDGTETAHLQPRSEINARYTMGWAVP